MNFRNPPSHPLRKNSSTGLTRAGSGVFSWFALIPSACCCGFEKTRPVPCPGLGSSQEPLDEDPGSFGKDISETVDHGTEEPDASSHAEEVLI